MPNVAITFRPLTQWPAGRALTSSREDAKFKAAGKYVDGAGYQAGERTSLARTLEELDRELWQIGATEVFIQVDVTRLSDVRSDGSLRISDLVRVKSPAIVLTFKRKGSTHTFACDRFLRWQDNLRGIVLGLEGLRRLERYGIVQSGEQYRGWQALPASTTPALSTEQAADIIVRRAATIGREYNAYSLVNSLDLTRSLYRAARAKSHPDAGGSANDFTLVTEAGRVLGAHFGVTL